MDTRLHVCIYTLVWQRKPIYSQTYTQVWDVNYFRTDRINSRTAADLTDPYGTIDWSHTGTVGLPGAHPPQGTPATDGVTRGQTLGAGGEGVAHINRVTEKLEGGGGERERERERERVLAYQLIKLEHLIPSVSQNTLTLTYEMTRTFSFHFFANNWLN